MNWITNIKMKTKMTNDDLMILLFSLAFLSIVIYSWITHNVLAKMFVVGLEGCYLLFLAVLQKTV